MDPSEPRELLGFEGEASILEESAFGIFNGMMTCGVPFRDAFALAGLFAPPYTSSNFVLDVRLNGERTPCVKYRWYPSSVVRAGGRGELGVRTSTFLMPGRRAGAVRATLENRSAHPQTVRLLIAVRGWLDQTSAWEFQRPLAQSPLDAAAVARGLSLSNAGGGLEIRADLGDCTWDPITRAGRASVHLGPGETRSLTIALALGSSSEAAAACMAIMTDPAATERGAHAADDAAANGLFGRLPRLEADDHRLQSFYVRSALSLPLHRWDVPELILRPYYGVGSINGGVAGCYLWDFSIAARMLALYEPLALRSHLLRFSAPAIGGSFGFSPVTGAPFGLWYAVNPEKTVLMTRDYVALTGDAQVLSEIVDGAPLIDRIIASALFGDDGSPEARLVDYREEKYHLELRRGFAYDNFVPDLNGRRAAVLRAAAELCDLVGRPSAALRARAEQVPVLLRQRLWDPDARWFRFIDARGASGMRFTNEMFELIGSGALDADQERGLLSHLNEDEFLSELGMHSISKRDPAYDPEDVDHGGGGCFVGIAPGIAERLYRSGYARYAEDLLRRILWWGERMPYWGDSMYGDRIDYRRDTPYAAALPAVAGAQAVIFGIFGISVAYDGAITVDPRPPTFSPRVALRGVRIRGRVFDVEARGASFAVRYDGSALTSEIGRPLRLEADA